MLGGYLSPDIEAVSLDSVPIEWCWWNKNNNIYLEMERHCSGRRRYQLTAWRNKRRFGFFSYYARVLLFSYSITNKFIFHFNQMQQRAFWPLERDRSHCVRPETMEFQRLLLLFAAWHWIQSKWNAPETAGQRDHCTRHEAKKCEAKKAQQSDMHKKLIIKLLEDNLVL